MKRLQPGLYVDENGGLHIHCAEYLTAHGFADNPANEATLLAAAQDMLGVPICVIDGTRPHITCPRCGFTSYHPKDIKERYCGGCHTFQEP